MSKIAVAIIFVGAITIDFLYWQHSGHHNGWLVLVAVLSGVDLL